MRLFTALPLPPHAVERLSRLRLRLASPGDGLRWSAPEQWHITLQFYGDVDPERAGCLCTALSAVALPGPEVVLEALGLFPGKGILYAAITPTPTLARLQEAVVTASSRCGISPDSRPFRPHITLARSKGRAGVNTLSALARPALPALGPPIRWMGDECLLLESILGSQGAQYTTQARVALVQP